MSRLEVYRRERQGRRLIKCMIIVFLFTLLTGLLVTDYSINSLWYAQGSISMLQFKSTNSYYELSVMNKKVYFNNGNFSRDLEKALRFAASFLRKS